MKMASKFADEFRKDNAFKDPEKVKGVMVLQAVESSQRAKTFSDDLRPRLKDEIQKLW